MAQAITPIIRCPRTYVKCRWIRSGTQQMPVKPAELGIRRSSGACSSLTADRSRASPSPDCWVRSSFEFSCGNVGLPCPELKINPGPVIAEKRK